MKELECQTESKAFEINGGQNCMVWRPFLWEVVPDRLGRENLVNR